MMKPLELLLRHRVKTALILLSLAGLGWWLHLHQDELSREAITEYGERLPAGWFIALFLLLPLGGFPLGVFLVLAGVRFGFAWGMVVSAVAVLFHNFAAYRLTHGLFRARLRAFLERAGYAIPPIDVRHRVRFTMIFTAIHGPPYVAKIYLLALTDIPFPIYFWVGSAVYIAFCAIPVAAGSAMMRFDPTWIYLIIGILAVLTIIGYWLRRRIAPSTAD